jgi:hypothetical protein
MGLHRIRPNILLMSDGRMRSRLPQQRHLNYRELTTNFKSGQGTTVCVKHGLVNHIQNIVLHWGYCCRSTSKVRADCLQTVQRLLTQPAANCRQTGRPVCGYYICTLTSYLTPW